MSLSSNMLRHLPKAMLRMCPAIVLLGIPLSTSATMAPLPLGVRSPGTVLQIASPDALGDPDIDATWEGTPRWMTGVNWGGQTFFGSVDRGTEFFGSNLTASDYVEVEIRFSTVTTTLCQTFRRDLSYASAGVGTFPGSAWDVSNPGSPRRLNICFVEDNNLGPADLTWNPNGLGSPTFGKREYLAIMNSDYDGTGTTYAGFNFNTGASSMDILYAWWPLVESGETFLGSLPAVLRVTPYYVKNARGIPADGQLTITWAYFNTPADKFRIYSDASSPATTQLIDVSGSARSYVHSGLTNGVARYYRIDALDALDEPIGSSLEFVATPEVVSSEMNLVEFWNDRGTYGDIWGYVDPNTNREYALICARNEGVSIIDLDLDPPAEVGFIPSPFPGSDSKDVKIYSHYAIVVNENADVQIVDIDDPTSPVQVSTFTPDGGGSHNCLVEGDYLYVVGNHGVGGLEIVSLANPLAPVEVGNIQPYYYHDLDIRNDTIYACGIYGDGIDVVDVSNKAIPSVITTFNYTGSGAHNCELSTDGKYLFQGDEIGSAGNHTRVWDVSDVNSISKVADIIVDPSAVVHNCYIVGNLLYVAHYTEGVHVFDVTDPTSPVQVAYYDTYQPAQYGYFGCWSVYPYLPSGRIIASDMQTGLYVMAMADADSDGVIDVLDNCPTTPNPAQIDSDSNGVGDACETCLCLHQGDYDTSLVIDALDLNAQIDALFFGGTEPQDPSCPKSRGDFDCSGDIDALDLNVLIEYLFFGGGGPCDPCAP